MDERLNPKKKIYFSTLQNIVNEYIDAYGKEEYNIACQIVHSSPISTFNRLCNPLSLNVVPIGVSQWGIQHAAINCFYTIIANTECFLLYHKSKHFVVLEAVSKFIKDLNKACDNVVNKMDNE